MRSIYDFIVKPVGKRYDNEVKVGEHTLVTNSSIESFKHVNNVAEVIETPAAFATSIKKGDLIVIHHNVFRVFYDMKGIKKNSRSFLKDGLFFCSIDQIYFNNKFCTYFGTQNPTNFIHILEKTVFEIKKSFFPFLFRKYYTNKLFVHYPEIYTNFIQISYKFYILFIHIFIFSFFISKKFFPFFISKKYV